MKDIIVTLPYTRAPFLQGQDDSQIVINNEEDFIRLYHYLYNRLIQCQDQYVILLQEKEISRNDKMDSLIKDLENEIRSLSKLIKSWKKSLSNKAGGIN